MTRVQGFQWDLVKMRNGDADISDQILISPSSFNVDCNLRQEIFPCLCQEFQVSELAPGDERKTDQALWDSDQMLNSHIRFGTKTPCRLYLKSSRNDDGMNKQPGSRQRGFQSMLEEKTKNLKRIN